MSDIVTVTETAMEAESMFTGPSWPPTVQVRYTGPDGMGAGVEITGERDEVLDFIRDGWGEDEADGVAEWLANTSLWTVCFTRTEGDETATRQAVVRARDESEVRRTAAREDHERLAWVQPA